MVTSPKFAKSTRVRLAGMGLAGLGLVLAGCASDPEPTDAPGTATSETGATTDAPVAGTDAMAVITQAGQKTIEAGSARFKSSGSTTSAGKDSSTPQVSSYSMEGSLDFEAQSMEAKLSGDLFGEQGDVEMITVGDTAYMKLPSLGGEKWLTTPVPEGTSGNTLSDPTKAFVDLGKLTKPKEVGPEMVDGVSATKYTGTNKDIKKVLAEAGVPVSEDDTAKLSGESETSVWIDDEGVIIKVSNQTRAEAGGAVVEAETSMSFFDLGSDLDIQAPPAEEVSDLSDLTSGVTQ